MKKLFSILVLFAIVANTFGVVTVLPSSATGLDTAFCQYPYQKFITASGGTSPYRYRVTVGTLPQGITLDSITGRLGGNVGLSVNQTVTVTIRARDAAGVSGTRVYNIKVFNKVLTANQLTNIWSGSFPPQRPDVYSTWYTTFTNQNTLAGSFWKYGGNTVTTNKNLGTVDNYDLPFITNNTEKMRLEKSGSLLIGTTTILQSGKLTVSGKATTTTSWNVYNNNDGDLVTVNDASANELIGMGKNSGFGTLQSYGNPLCINAAGNGVAIGVNATIGTNRFYVKGTGATNATNNSEFVNSNGTSLFSLDNNGKSTFGNVAASSTLLVNNLYGTNLKDASVHILGNNTPAISFEQASTGYIWAIASGYNDNTSLEFVVGASSGANPTTTTMKLKPAGVVNMINMPTDSTGLAPGDLFRLTADNVIRMKY